MTVVERTLIFDADDTLWENNVRFDRTFEAYLAWVGAPEAIVRELFTATEIRNIGLHGYGSGVFVRSLHETFAELHGRAVTDLESAHISDLAADLLDHRVEPMPGVVETLTVLGQRHRLLLMTKGQVAEQQAKIDTSGLASHFAAIEIVPEKDPATYRALAERHGLDPERTWMIGNSPKSDINAARGAGLRAVLIPNANTWALEHEDVDHGDPHIAVVTTISDLVDLFIG